MSWLDTTDIKWTFYFQKVEAPKVTLGILFWILNEHSVQVSEKKNKVGFWFICIFKKYMFCVQLYGKWVRWGRYNLYFEAIKGSLLKKERTLIFFPDFCRKCHAPLPEHKLIPLGPQPHSIKKSAFSMWLYKGVTELALKVEPAFHYIPSWSSSIPASACHSHPCAQNFNITVVMQIFECKH